MGNMGLALQKGAILSVVAAAGNLPPQDLTLTPKRDPKSAPRAPKRTLKNGSIDTGPQTDTQKGPQISTPVPQKDPPKTEVATQRWQPHTAQLIKQILYITY